MSGVTEKLQKRQTELQTCSSKLSSYLDQRDSLFSTLYTTLDLDKTVDINQKLVAIKDVIHHLKKRKSYLKKKITKYETRIEPQEDLSELNEYKQSKLHIAIRNSNFERSLELIQSGISLNHTDMNDRTAFMYAIQQEHTSPCTNKSDYYTIIDKMLDVGYDINFETPSTRRSVLDEQMNLEMLDYLLKKELKPQGKRGLLRFLQAGGVFRTFNHDELLKLLERGLDPNVDYFLHAYARSLKTVGKSKHEIDDAARVVQIALKFGADPLIDENGKTPLQYAIEHYESDSMFNQSRTKEFINIFATAEAFKRGEQCSICLASKQVPFENAKTGPCMRHVFHSDCLEKWYLKKRECPNCKATER